MAAPRATHVVNALRGAQAPVRRPSAAPAPNVHMRRPDMGGGMGPGQADAEEVETYAPPEPPEELAPRPPPPEGLMRAKTPAPGAPIAPNQVAGVLTALRRR